MIFPSTLLVLSAPLFVSALPLRKRAIAASDLLVLKFANVLEQLETQFYNEAVAKFNDNDFLGAGFSSALLAKEQFQNIIVDETTHTTVLKSTIESFGEQAVSTCTFNFDAVLGDVTTMTAVARLVENVGVGAYLGAAHLIEDPILLTAAASILTIEARHQTILNVLTAGTAIPQAFDIPLTPSEVLALAGGFISGCDLGIPALPALAVTNTGSVLAGTSLTFSAPQIAAADPSTLSCQMLAGGMPFSLSLPFSSCIVPEGLTGPVAIWVTNNTQPLINNPRDRFAGNIVAGPTMAFIDNKPQVIGSLARTTGQTVTGQQQVTPDQASRAAAGASTPAAGASSAASSSSAPPAATSSSSSVSASATPAGATPAGATPAGATPAGATPASANPTPSAAGSSSSSSASASSSGSESAAATPSPVSNVATPQQLNDNTAAINGPNLATGPAADGATTVLGWSTVPA